MILIGCIIMGALFVLCAGGGYLAFMLYHTANMTDDEFRDFAANITWSNHMNGIL